MCTHDGVRRKAARIRPLDTSMMLNHVDGRSCMVDATAKEGASGGPIARFYRHLTNLWQGCRMTIVRLTDDQWIKMRAFLASDANAYVGTDDHVCRRFVEAVLWIDRSGAKWRLLPSEYGQWNSVYKRFARWCDQGVWDRMLAHFADDPDMKAQTQQFCGAPQRMVL